MNIFPSTLSASISDISISLSVIPVTSNTIAFRSVYSRGNSLFITSKCVPRCPTRTFFSFPCASAAILGVIFSVTSIFIVIIPTNTNLVMYIQPRYFLFTVTLNHTKVFPSISLIKSCVVSNQIDR